ncbi:ABC transporter permease [Desulfotalea psychrophila]|uniref:Similar to lipoprotein releasing system transmembrane protein n=1 Tax=Desulfotalea psychrophila (strain LSv54 / DSM 12343) TaxID=177439 RepID=Q6AMB3_DESPS|nr:FtsX-like permease family protein [Desulfotalea psychrophila]CAG36512.1 similar to lipoprotein releasing system transmembrane protein [Desulfotalea psychrophila LSv54]
MLSLKLAYRNLLGAGLRTWLNAIVLSMVYVIIIWQQGLLDGWKQQALRDMLNWEIGGGQYWQQNYDPYDPLSLEESHAPVPRALQDSKDATPILIVQATIYPQGRMQSCLLKGITPKQEILHLPSADLQLQTPEIPILLGTRMAESTNLQKGDTVTIRWRDAHGVFDAAEGKVVAIMKTNVPAIDQGQLWLPLERLQAMMQLAGEASIIVMDQETKDHGPQKGFIFRDREFLSQDFNAILQVENISGYILYTILLSLALLAIFDTQVLAIFRRRREIGTLIALGMPRGAIIRLFTLEGTMHGILAIFVAAIYGIPLLYIQATWGIPMPEITDSYGLAISDRIFPIYGASLIFTTIFIVMVIVTIVSFIPARKISHLSATDAIKGKLP